MKLGVKAQDHPNPSRIEICQWSKIIYSKSKCWISEISILRARFSNSKHKREREKKEIYQSEWANAKRSEAILFHNFRRQNNHDDRFFYNMLLLLIKFYFIYTPNFFFFSELPPWFLIRLKFVYVRCLSLFRANSQYLFNIFSLYSALVHLNILLVILGIQSLTCEWTSHEFIICFMEIDY